MPADQQYLLIALATVLLGFAKAGFPNTAALISVPLIMQALPANQANALTLILMMATDIPASLVQWGQFEPVPLRKIIIPIILGIIITSIGWYFLLLDRSYDEYTTRIVKQMVGLISICFACYVFAKEYFPKQLLYFPWKSIHGWTWGLIIGITTAIANASGPVMGLYLYTEGVDQKEKFTGTMAWSFLIINWLKFPCLVLSGVITTHELWMSLKFLWWIPLGIVLGQFFLRIVNQRVFNSLIVAISIWMGVRLCL
jgi:hypothetical protein